MTATIDTDRLINDLRGALPPDSVSTTPKPRFVVDGLMPALVVTPGTQAEVAAALRLSGEAGAAVVPFGGGTQQSLGMPPERYDVGLDMRRIDALVEHEPADLTVTVEAGMRLAELQRHLASRGQWLPLDPELPDEATIGGVLATNASGPARLSRGTARDLLIGLTVATAEGELVKSGGRVVKNVAGYDMGKLHIGGLGTAGVIVQASFKVAPQPPETAVVMVHGALDEMALLAGEIVEARLALQGLLLAKSPLGERWTLAARFAAGAAAVERSIRDTNDLAVSGGLDVSTEPDAAWRDLQIGVDSGDVIVRASVMPSDLRDMAHALASAGASVAAQPGVGVLQGMWPEAPDSEVLRSLRKRAEDTGGALVIEKGPAELRRSIDAWGSARGDFALMQHLKREMDPKRTLNPGRFVGEI